MLLVIMIGLTGDRVKFHINYINSYQYQYTLAFGNLVSFRGIHAL